MREKETYSNILPEYGRRRLLMYADSIRELASTFHLADKPSEEELTPLEIEDRKDVIWQRRLQENKGIMAEHLKEMAKIMTKVAEESRRFAPMGERRYKHIAHALKAVNIQIRDVYILENEDGYMELSLVLRSSKQGNTVTVEEIGDVISVLLNNRMTPSANNPFFVSQDWQTFYYVEEAHFHVLTGVAKAVKETEKISGDNYAIFETEPGSLAIALSDGMGSGSKACRDSSMIVDLMQKFMEAGFQKEIAVQMINSVLLAGAESGNMSTLDLCKIDLYSGLCEFVKIGSSSSYIKREHLVDRISAGNLPLGIFNRPDMEIVQRRLLDGDYVIMLSDGILDALSQGIGEDMMTELIGGCDLKNPGEIANALLNFSIHQSKGKIRDDMTVLVIGIWEKEAH